MKFYISFRKFVLIPDLRTWCEYINNVFVVNFSSGPSLRESQQLKARISSIRVNLVPKMPRACLYVPCWIWSGRHRRCPRQAFSTFLFLLVTGQGGKFNQDCSNQQIFKTPRQLFSVWFCHHFHLFLSRFLFYFVFAIQSQDSNLFVIRNCWLEKCQISWKRYKYRLFFLRSESIFWFI